MPKSKKQTYKIGRCVRKKIDDKDFLVMRVSGKVPAKTMRELKQNLNDTVEEFTSRAESEDES